MQYSGNGAKATSPLLDLSTWKRVLGGRLPGQVVIQYTDRCNAACAQCGMRASNAFERTKMDVDSVKRMLDAMARQGVQAVSFTGGEPLLCLDEIVECIRHAGAVGIRYIRTGTNGFIFRGHDKPGFEDKIHTIASTLAESPVNTFWVSVDSAVPEVHEANRGLAGVIKGIEKGLPIFHQHGLHPSANLGINRHIGGRENLPDLERDGVEVFREHFRQSFRRFYGFVEELGFTIVNACYPMSLDADEAEGQAVYAATSVDDFIRFTPAEKVELFTALYETVPEFRSRLRIFTPRSSLLALIREYRAKVAGNGSVQRSHACRGGIDFFFIDSRDGNTYPCGYRGAENLGKFWDLDLGALKTEAWCRQCDWECFRDPSELAGPLLDLPRRPASLIGRMLRDAEYRRAWRQDLSYYRACGYFSARTPPQREKLARFAP